MSNTVTDENQLVYAYSSFEPNLYTATVQIGAAGASDIGFIPIFRNFPKESILYGLWVDIAQVAGAAAADQSNFRVWISTAGNSNPFKMFHRRPHDTNTAAFDNPPSQWVTPWPGWGIAMGKNAIISVENITGSIAAILICKALIGQ